MKVNIFGLGYVGAVSLGCLARDGHEVTGVDIDPAKLNLLRAGQTPIIEAGMQELIRESVASGRVTITDDTVRAVQGAEVSFICVGTPSLSNGGQDLTAIERLFTELAAALRERDGYHLFVVRSTIFPGTVEKVIVPRIEQLSGLRAGEHFDICFQPEFLREGSSIKDYDNPPFTVIGTTSAEAESRMRELFGHLECEFIVTSVRTAEMLKYACNIFHAAKITFANEIGRLSASMDVDPHEVMDIVCRDTRPNISPAYLRPGFAFGGSCLPKDLKAMLHVARTRDQDVPMLAGVLPSNQIHIDQAADVVLSRGRCRVGMLGLSFKSGTDDLRESPLVTMVERFIGKGLDLSIYDPEVNLSRLTGANRRYIEESIPHIASLMREDCDAVVRDAQVIVVGLDDPHILDAVRQHATEDQLVLDLVNIPHRGSLRAQYRGVCW